MTTDERIGQLEGQVQALSQLCLRLVALSELAGNHQPDELKRELLSIRWPGSVFEPAARYHLLETVNQLDQARLQRKIPVPSVHPDRRSVPVCVMSVS